ncbi:MAG: hypothetical protein IJT09_02450 [Abditibacteriota bacterium]|nr:hypothetical protein [Abditibacteriota bacterium]
MKKLLALLAVTLLTSAAYSAGTKFPISFWTPPSPLTEENVKDVADGGFNVYYDYLHTGPGEQLRLLDLCHKYGMKVQVVDERIKKADPKDPNFSRSIREAVATYKNHPATWGYHIIDEPFPPVFHDKAKIAAEVRAEDPDHVAFINVHCYGVSFVFPDQFDKGDHERYVDELLNTSQINILSYDQYILMEDRKNDLLGPYFTNLECIRSKAIQHNLPINSIILDIKHWKYRDPSDDDIRWQVYTSLAYGSKGILYFTYAVPGGNDFDWNDALLDKAGNKTRRYYAAKKINHEIIPMGDILWGLTSVGVFHTGNMIGPTKPIPARNLIQLTGGQFVLGQFVSENGSLYAMVANRSMTEKQTAYLKFAQGVDVYEVAPHGGRGFQTGADKWQKTLNPGDGVLIRIEPRGPLYALWNYNSEYMPRLSVYAPTAEDVKVAEEAKALLKGKVNVFVIGSECKDPAHVARRLRSDAYLIMGNKSAFMPYSMDMSKKLAWAIDPAAKEEPEALGDTNRIFCPAAVVNVDDADVLADGILDYFKK